MLTFFTLQLVFLLLSSFMVLNAQGKILFNLSCSTSGNYMNGSTFQVNLGELISSLPEKTINNFSFFTDTVGKSPDQVYGLAMCYYDRATSLESCRSCLTDSVNNIINRCPNSVAASLLLQGVCFIRYSNENFFSNIAPVPLAKNSLCITSSNDTGYPTDHDNYMQVVVGLLDKLTMDVANSAKLLARTSMESYGPHKVYGFVQCTRDLSVTECQNCLKVEKQWIQGSNPGCNGATGCNIYTFNCYMRYEGSDNESIHLHNPLPPTSLPPSPSPLPPVHQPRNDKVKIVATVVAAALAILLVITAILCVSRQRRTKGSGADSLEARQDIGVTMFGYKKLGNSNVGQATELIMFDFDTLREATNNFSNENKLGEGGFGQVFKATLQNYELAVKRLSTTSEQGIAELQNEVELIGKLKHRNLVKILGSCIEEKEKLLCYEYLPNGSLDKILFATDLTRRKELDWKSRFNIIEGVCRGLVYLHVDSGATIVHRDLKAGNILLDKNMNPKISDFGTSRLFDEDQTRKYFTDVIGTLGYFAPEYCSTGVYTAKSDVFSFGVIVLEIVTGRRCKTGLVSEVWRHWSEGKVAELKDPVLPDMFLDQVTVCIHIGLLCVNPNPEERPSITEVYSMLNRPSPGMLPPLPPGNPRG